jgi:hypothetical protein
MESVQRRLGTISNAVNELVDPKVPRTPERQEQNRQTIDRERNEIIRTLNIIWAALGIPRLPIPTGVDICRTE